MVAIQYARILNLMEMNRKVSANVGHLIGSMIFFLFIAINSKIKIKIPWSTWNVVRANAIIWFKNSLSLNAFHSSIWFMARYLNSTLFRSLSYCLSAFYAPLCIPHHQAINMYPLFSCRRILTIKIEIVLRNTIECVCVHCVRHSQYRFVCCAYTR